jgi:hypothetical protein
MTRLADSLSYSYENTIDRCVAYDYSYLRNADNHLRSTDDAGCCDQIPAQSDAGAVVC